MLLTSSVLQLFLYNNIHSSTIYDLTVYDLTTKINNGKSNNHAVDLTFKNNLIIIQLEIRNKCDQHSRIDEYGSIPKLQHHNIGIILAYQAL